MAPDTTRDCANIRGIKYTSEAKWDLLFDDDIKEWIAFKPALDMHVYPCYSCRNMFYSKKSFLDHVNRRCVVLHYKCPECVNEEFTFYNRCAFLLHCRKHFGLDKGQINLNNLELSTLPIGMAGFSRHPDVSYLFDVEEEIIPSDTFMNAQFYVPKSEDKGKCLITLVPNFLTINRAAENGENQSLSVKQIAKNIPKCQFISMQALEELRNKIKAMMGQSDLLVEIKSEPDESSTDASMSGEPVIRKSTNAQVIVSQSPEISPSVNTMTLPIITKVETVEEPLGPPNGSASNRKDLLSPTLTNGSLQKCTECESMVGSLSSHFLGENRPLLESLRCTHCKLISPSQCAFQAHVRIHEKRPPFVCPDCGNDYPEVGDLMNHMDEVCYHMTKSVRYRCPGRRCGKIFASDATFGPHFKQAHIDTLYTCSACDETFNSLEECEEHCLTHDADASIVKQFSCPTCSIDDMSWHQLKKHLDNHCKDLSRCIFIFMCKFCKCYFRSVQTMGTHLRNCKVQKTGIPRRFRSSNPSSFAQSKYVSGQCQFCGNKIICLKAKPSTCCSKCLAISTKPPPFVKKPTVQASDKCVCILCKAQINFKERRQHQMECKYAKPQVMVERCDLEKMMEDSLNPLDQSFSSSNSDLESSHEGSPQKASSDDNRPRKRFKPSRPRKADMEDDLTAEGPIQFDGTYQCRLCDYKNTERGTFHGHVKTHRHISTAYQCMECGECFVVKPSLVKHLLHFHNIADAEQYFTENDCFDKSAVTELAKVVKAPYLAKEVKENQCKVCMEQFEDSESHDKHFRTHGMAFLMKNSI